MTRRFSLLLLALLAVLFTAPPVLADAGGADARARLEATAAGTDDRAAAEALYQLGQLDEVAMAYPQALAHYVAVSARLASSPFTPRANRRALDLRTHAEGDFAPLVRLETVRRSPALSNDPAAIDALVRDAAAFPPGRVRVEARMLAAEAYAGRLQRLADALPLLQAVADDPKADVVTGRLAASELLAAYTDARDYASASRVAERYPSLLPLGTPKEIARLLRRGPIRTAATLDLGVLAGFALLALARPRRAAVLQAVGRLLPTALLFAALATGLAGFLASRYEQSNPYPFAAMAPAMLVVFLLSRTWSADASQARGARALRATLAFVGVFAAAFLMLDRMDPAYLGGFGL